MESPPTMKYFLGVRLDRFSDRFINWTMTYRRDADVICPYSSWNLLDLKENLDEERRVVDAIVSNKSRVAVSSSLFLKCLLKFADIFNLNLFVLLFVLFECFFGHRPGALKWWQLFRSARKTLARLRSVQNKIKQSPTKSTSFCSNRSRSTNVVIRA